MLIFVKLGGRLRDIVPNHVAGLVEMEVEPGTKVSDVLNELNLGGDEVRVLLYNGKQLKRDEFLVEGDRLAFFPKELAFNMYMATAFYNPLATETIKKKQGEE